MTTELRKRPLLGTRAFLHSIVLDDVVIYEQVGPFSEEEVESRVAAHIAPSTSAAVIPRAREWSAGGKGGRKGEHE